jgi:CheY-like chemotaxis protein
MSHEIRTPMNAILGFGDILSDLITDKIQRFYLNAIQTSGKTLLQLINDVLDLSKIEAGKLELDYKAVELKTVFDDIHLIFMQKISEKSLDFSIEIAENTPPVLFLDDIRLRQILLNLVGNAIKFTSHGFVRISVNPSGFQNQEGLVDLTIDVEDSGIGISQDQQDRIFDSFTQQKNQSAKFGGTGLGLTISKRLIEMMGGTISVRSQKGIGSCFTLSLPQVEICHQSTIPTEKKALLSLNQAAPFQPASLLLVDDLESNRLLVTSYLHEYPELAITEAESGEQALELIKQHHFDLILMDRRLPGEDGDSVCKKIKSLSDCVDIPIIMITASALLLPETEEQSIFYDVQLNKPVNKNELLSAMQIFLPINEDTVRNSQILTETVQTSFEEIAAPEKLSELVALLKTDYQAGIAKLNNSGALQVDSILEIAQQLIQIAQQYHCKPLYEWANELKTQAELFDLAGLSKTLTGFDSLLKKLRNEYEINYAT